MHIFFLFFKQIQDLSLCHYQGYTDQSLDLYELEITVTLSTFQKPHTICWGIPIFDFLIA